MNDQLLPKVDHLIEKYEADHRGEKPLYILVSPYEADTLLDEARRSGGHSPGVLVTEYKGCKILRHDALKKGDFQLSNELPDIGG